MSSRGSLKLY